MQGRTAYFSVTYFSGDNTEGMPASGRCTIVDRDNDAYYRWAIDTDMRYLAYQHGRYNFLGQKGLDERFAAAQRSLIRSIHRSRRWKPYRFRVHDWSWTTTPVDAEPGHQILATLENIRQRPGMYISLPSLEGLEHFLHGFGLGCLIAGWGIKHTPESPYHTVVEAHGWRFSAMSPAQQMRERGWDNFAIIDRLITIEKETWSATYNLE